MKVCFKQHIASFPHGSSSDDVWLSYVIQLEFVPPVGMEVCEGDWGATVESLAYKDGIVFAFCKIDREVSGAQNGRTMSEVVAEYESTGWRRSSGILSV